MHVLSREKKDLVTDPAPKEVGWGRKVRRDDLTRSWLLKDRVNTREDG